MHTVIGTHVFDLQKYHSVFKHNMTLRNWWQRLEWIIFTYISFLFKILKRYEEPNDHDLFSYIRCVHRERTWHLTGADRKLVHLIRSSASKWPSPHKNYLFQATDTFGDVTRGTWLLSPTVPQKISSRHVATLSFTCGCSMHVSMEIIRFYISADRPVV